MHRLALVFLITLVASLGGCDGQRSVASDFEGALPEQSSLQIAVPGGGAGSAHAVTLGETATFYAITRLTSNEINAQVGFVLAVLYVIVHTPPTEVAQDRAVWGPFPGNALDPLAYRLVVTREGRGEFAYHLDARRKSSSSESDYRALITGTAWPSTPIGRGHGDFRVDLTAGHELDPVATRASGAILVAYDFGAEPRGISVHYEGVSGDGMAAPVTADYKYQVTADGAGDFQFGATANLIHDTAAVEEGVIRSRWSASGAGRADARAIEGDAGAGATVTECWDTSFQRVYISFTPTGGATTSEGNVADCAFADSLLPTL